MTDLQRTTKQLTEHVEIWNQHVDGSDNELYEPLCSWHMKQKSPTLPCATCPVQMFTNVPYCEHTPFRFAIEVIIEDTWLYLPKLADRSVAQQQGVKEMAEFLQRVKAWWETKNGDIG